MSQDSDVRWAVVGPGRIAAKVVGDFAHVPGARVVGAASRSLARARTFADAHGLQRAYGSYAEVIADDDIDVLYVATPHPQHHAIAVAALQAGKAVLVEKTFTATVAGAQDVIDTARKQGVFAMEAMWTRFQPAIVAARALVADGAIGEIRQLEADLGVDRPYDPTDRLFDPAQGGGVMLDLGVYLVSLAQHFLGTADRLTATGSLTETGVDAEAGLLLSYADGRAATLLGSLKHHSPGAARLIGTEGWIDIQPRFHHPRTIVLTRKGAEPETITKPPSGDGYSHELVEVTDCVRAGRTESAVMPLDDTLAVQRILNEACEQLGVTHHEDDSVEV
ncbi:MAG TPA: Gfo/Idh/MocA family oxidoreductase [Propionibacteriaceae bacterium]|nr:Gfo/Idh/MocA family oxidoreductase [Propionibacteriaceae bacterium]